MCFRSACNLTLALQHKGDLKSMKKSNSQSQLHKLYGQMRMSWKNVILFALLSGIYAGVMMVIPALKNTSFQDIGIAYEWWVIFAVIVVVNCRKNWEAMLKCFVFFLLSQPTIYGVEVLLKHITMSDAIYYYRLWLMPTILTIPGGLIAFYCKKQNAFGAVILGLGNTIQLVMGIAYAVQCAGDFPHHILSCLVSILSIFVMSFAIQQEKKNRLISLLLPLALTGVLAVLAALTGRLHF